MTPKEVLAELSRGRRFPILLVLGSERWLRDQVVTAARAAALGGAAAGFDEDKFTAGESDVDRVLSACRTMPMIAKTRFVLCRSVERWDGARGDGDEDDGKKASPLDALLAYAKNPSPAASLVLVAEKLDGRRKLFTHLKGEGLIVGCEPLDLRGLTAFAASAFASRGHPVEDDVVELLAEVAGPELGHLEDAIERLSLYVGPGGAVDDAAVAECVVRVRKDDTWALVDAVGARDFARAAKVFADCYEPRDRGLPLLGALAWSLRQLLRFSAGLDAGLPEQEAARKAGVFQPFRARELATKARRFRGKELERILVALAEADRALKGSRRPPEEVLHDLLLKLCGGPRSAAIARA